MKKQNLFFFIVLFYFIFSRTIFAQLIIQKINDLNFGEVFIGYSSTVTDLSPDAAKFMLYQNSQARMDLIVTFTLPASLNNGINSVKIDFNNYASWARSDVQTGRTYVNPYSPFLINNVRKNRYHYIWLGGTIISNSNILPGIYTGTIILTVEVL